MTPDPHGDEVEVVGNDAYCEVCKPGMIVVANNIPKSLHESWPMGASLVLKNAPCVCNKAQRRRKE